MIYRKATEKDLDEILVIENEVMPLPWSFCSFHEAAISDHTLFLVAEADDGIAGYIVMYLMQPEAELPDIVIKESYQGHGIGTELLRLAIEELKERTFTDIFLEVRVSNAAAIRVYEKLGFKEIGTRKSFYKNPVEDAICMKLSI